MKFSVFARAIALARFVCWSVFRYGLGFSNIKGWNLGCSYFKEFDRYFLSGGKRGWIFSPSITNLNCTPLAILLNTLQLSLCVIFPPVNLWQLVPPWAKSLLSSQYYSYFLARCHTINFSIIGNFNGISEYPFTSDFTQTFVCSFESSIKQNF